MLCDSVIALKKQTEEAKKQMQAITDEMEAKKQKEKAQQYIGLDMAVERQAKEKFLNTVVPEWIKEAKANKRLAEKI